MRRGLDELVRPGAGYVSKVAVGLLLTALTASCTSEPSAPQDRSQDGGSPSGKSSPAGGSGTSVTALELTRLPPIVQPGATGAAAGDARSVLVASTEPATSGALLTLQRRTDDGWGQVATERTGKGGLATFAVPQGATGTSAQRVVVKARPQVRSEGAEDGWNLEFSDEFDGTDLSSKWSYRSLGVLSAESGRKVSASSEDAVEVRDGTVRLQVERDPDAEGQFLNGHISTEDSYLFRYGVAAARVKFQRPRGTHGAFWSQSPTYGKPPGDPGAAGTEVDIGEYFGEGAAKGGMASYVYHADEAGENVKEGDVLPRAVRVVGSADSFWKRYHVYSVEWSPDGYVFRIDGRPTFRTGKAVSARTQFLVLSLLSSDWELPRLDRSLLPAQMQVDWVRVWQRPKG